MMRNPAMAVLAMAALGLAACDQRHDMAGNPKVCFDFKTAKPAAAPAVAGAEGAAPVEDCVRKWAYSLAGSRDDAGTVAEAAVAACNLQLVRWNQQSLSQPGADIEANSLITGQPTTPLSEHSAFVHARALLYVVQARAGQCAPPPMTNGVPDGVS
jgi:predicted outer membrane protein